MNEMSTPFLAQAAGYHSPEDARRMQQLVQAMLSDRRHIALTSPDAETLAHYSRLLVRDLRQHPAVKVLPHLPSTSDVMLDRFNELLADLPLDAVVDRHTPMRRPVQVFVVHDTPALTAEELALLVRLVNDLPGANLRLVLVQERDLDFAGSLQALGPQVLHWNILPPGMTAAQVAEAERSREALRNALQGARDDARRGSMTTPTPSWMRRKPPAPSREAGPPPARRVATATARAITGPKERPPARPGRESRPAAPVSTSSPAASRTNWALLTGGLALSAALAIALGVWISTHTPASKTVAAATAGTPR